MRNGKFDNRVGPSAFASDDLCNDSSPLHIILAVSAMLVVFNLVIGEIRCVCGPWTAVSG